ncbi:MAG: 50S ribosomal protein L1 [Victivallales bacterium]|nr:50S ribosomal protein L1 [Victivallales bacterium]
MKRSKLYRSRLEKVDRTKLYSVEEAVAVLKSMPTSQKFEETVEVAFRLGIDPKQSDQMVRGAMVLPHGTGKTQRVAVVAEGEFAIKAKEAGADEVGFEELINKIKGGWFEFDVLIATPGAMKQVRTLGRVLGPRGLMPNPKTGTVTEDVAKAVAEAKAGRVEYRSDKGGCIHMPVGKIGFAPEKLVDNLLAVQATILRVRPAAVKGVFVKAWTLTSTMGPGIRMDTKVGAKV